jgi:hypothetical protein
MEWVGSCFSDIGHSYLWYLNPMVAFLDHAFLTQGIAICGIFSQQRS